MKVPRSIRNWVVRPVVAASLMVGGWMAWTLAHHNLATIADGRVYRSGQMSGEALARTLRGNRIRTVLNLRGPNPDQEWYRAEKSATLAAGATQVDVSMASDLWLSRAQARTLVEVLDTCDYPIIIHCQWGAERTGLVAAFIELMRPGGSLDAARAQFSARYLFLPVGDGKVMLAHLDQYESWLRTKGVEHSPARFRRWIAEDYRPGPQSREHWRRNPYPLKVVTRPEVTKR